MLDNTIISNIQSHLQSDKSVLLEEPKFIEDISSQEFLIFLKPELFFGNSENVQNSLTLVMKKMMQFDVQMTGIAVVSAEDLEMHGVMSAHYGYINFISNNASKIETEDKEKIAQMLGHTVDSLPQILGGHEILKKYPNWTAAELDKFWFTKKSMRLRGGFYFNEFNLDGTPTVMINAFHPAQIEHFTTSGRHIVMFVGQSIRSFEDLRTNMIGDTYPEKSVPGSIRAELFANPKDYGQEKVDIGNNGIHMSAGPFEALKEIYNFYHLLFGVDLIKNPTNIMSALFKNGLSIEATLATKENPINSEGKDLFSKTEIENTQSSIDIYLEEFSE